MSKENKADEDLKISDNLRLTISTFLTLPRDLVYSDYSERPTAPIDANTVIEFMEKRMTELSEYVYNGGLKQKPIIDEFESKKNEVYKFVIKNFTPPEKSTGRGNFDSVKNLIDLF